VNDLSVYFLFVWIYVTFVYCNFNVICLSSTQQVIFISSVAGLIQEAIIILCSAAYSRKPMFYIGLQLQNLRIKIRTNLFLGYARPRHYQQCFDRLDEGHCPLPDMTDRTGNVVLSICTATIYDYCVSLSEF
jgi:hypothetical protein